jgi:hypothetical protein
MRGHTHDRVLSAAYLLYLPDSTPCRAVLLPTETAVQQLPSAGSGPSGPLNNFVEFRRKPRVKYLSVLPPFLRSTGWSKKKRTPGPIFGSPAAGPGTPVRRGRALARRPATAGPPGANPKPMSGCFIGRGCRSHFSQRYRGPYYVPVYVRAQEGLAMDWRSISGTATW